jgi:hypothetical protein
MTKYYFLVDKNKTYSVGPFLEIQNNDDVFIGQIIRSNEFSMEYTKDNTIYFELYSINCNLNLFDTKFIIHDNLNNLDILNNVNKICVFNGKIDISSSMISTILDKTYSLTFSFKNNLIMCPMLKIIPA